MNSGVYRITNVINGKVYIGSSKDIQKRKYTHWYELKKGVHYNEHLQRAYDKYGQEVFHFLVLEYCEPELLVEREDYWIDYFDSRNPDKGYNLKKADRSEMSEETKAKLASIRKLQTPPMLGKKHTEETRTKISNSQKGGTPANKGKPSPMRGKKQSPETIAKKSASMIGHSVSEETRAKLSLARKGKPWSEAQQAADKGQRKGKPWSEARRAAQDRKGKV